jgi:NitT/TauT family transport system substrate-binding protein
MQEANLSGADIMPKASLYGRRETLRRLALLGLGGAGALGYGALATRGLIGANMFDEAPPAALPPITHQLGWLKGVQFGGEFLADELGYLKEEGITAEFTAGGPGTDYRTLVASGRMLVSESTPLAMIEGAVQGQPLVAFAAVMQRDPGAFMSAPERPITSLQDMVGKTIGVPASVRKLAAVLLRRAGIDPDTINFVPVGTDAGMLAARLIDGYYSHATTAVPGLRALGMDPHVLYMSDLGVPSYAQAFIVRQDTLEKHHDLLVRYTRALIKGWRYFVDNPQRSAELITEKWAQRGTKLDDQLAQAALMRDFILAGDASTKGLLWIDPAVFQKALGFAEEAGTVPPGRKLDVSKLVTQSVIKEATATL